MSRQDARWPGRRVFRLPATGKRVRDVVDAELLFHLEGRVEDLVARGMSRAEAEAETRRRFGDVDAYRREACSIDETIIRDKRRMDLSDAVGREARQALRSLVRSRSFSLISILTLALGIGATTAIFTLLESVAIRPLPYPNADRLVHLASSVPGIRDRWGLARAELFYFTKNSRTFEDIGLYRADDATVLGDGSAQNQTERARTSLASASLFNVLGMRPSVGRLLTAEDNLSGRPSVVVLGNGYWTRRFGADPRAVGRVLDVDGFPMQVVGVLERGADLPDLRIDLWMPLHLDPAEPARNNHVFQGLGRLKPGVTPADAEADLRPLTARLPEVFPGAYSPRFMKETGFSTEVKPLREEVIGGMAHTLWILFASVGLVLLIAAANVANLFLVRVDARRREVAVRTALGADHVHLALHYITESLLLTVVAGACGLALADLTLRLVLALAPSDLPRLSEVRLAWPSVVFAAAVSLVAGVVFGLVPLARADVDLTTLREGSRGLTATRYRNAVRAALVIGQMALALLLLSGAGLMARSFRHLGDVRPGFDPAGVLTMTVALPSSRYDTHERASAFYEQLAARVRSFPGVQAVGVTESIPLDGNDGCTSVITPVGSTSRGACIPTKQVSPGYFEAMGIRVVGRAPDWAQTDRRAGTVVVSRALAARLWPGEDAIGKSIKCCNYGVPYYRVGGITEDVRGLGFDKPPVAAAYFPMIPIPGAPIESNPGYKILVVRGRATGHQALTAAIRRTVAALDPQVPIDNVQSMETMVARSMARQSFTMVLLVLAGLMALVLSAVGIYGVISYVVGQRRTEIGIRMALGARMAQVGGLVVAQSLRLALGGVLAGVLAAVAATRVLRSLLFEVSPTDPVTIGSAAILLLLIAALASYAPARRAAQVDPAEALRGE